MYMYIQTGWISRAGSFCLLRTNFSDEDTELFFYTELVFDNKLQNLRVFGWK